jgi:regulator of nonsense transcripts 2
VDFLIQDTYSLVRPQWKIASDLEEATRLFSEAVSQNYSLQEGDKAIDPEEEELESVSSDGNVEDGLEEDLVPEGDEEQSSTEEAEVGIDSLKK